MKTNSVYRIVGLGVLALVLLAVLLLIRIGGPLYSSFMASVRPPDPVVAVEIPKSEESFYSSPKDPWSVPAVPIDTYVLVLPFPKDGIIDEQSFLLMRMIATEWILGMPRSAMAARPDYVSGELGRMAAYSSDGNLKYDPAYAVQLQKFLNPTHTLSGQYREENGEWILDASLDTGFASTEKQFRVRAGNDYELSALVCEWLAASELIPAASRSEVCGYPFGKNVLSSDAPLYREMQNDAGHPEWKKLLEESKTQTRRLDLMMQYACHQDRRDIVEQLDPGPLDASASLTQLELRAEALEHYGQTDALRHHRELMMALYPGDPLGARAYLFNLFDKGQMREDYLTGVNNWLKRTRANGLSLAWAASAHAKSAWDWRGGGWASTVTDNAYRNFHKNNLRAIELYEEANRVFAVMPYPTAELIGVYGSESQESKMQETFELAISTYPGYEESWERYLNYLRPRWGGSHEEAMAVIDRALDDYPEFPNLGGLVYTYHGSELDLEHHPSNNEYENWKAYVSDYPDRDAQIRRGIERLASPGAHPRDVCRALRMAILYRDDAYRTRIAKGHRGYHDYARPGNYGNMTADLLYACLMAYLENNQFEDAASAYEMAIKQDAKEREMGSQSWKLVFQDDAYQAQIKYLMDSMLSKSAPTVDLNPVPVSKWDYYLYCKFLFVGADPGDRKLVERFVSETKTDGDYLLAFVLRAEGKNDEAQGLARRVLDNNTVWAALRPSFEESFFGTSGGVPAGAGVSAIGSAAP